MNKKNVKIIGYEEEEKQKMAIGFVLIHISPLHEYEIFNTLSKFPEIIELHPLFGEYDLLAKIKAENYEKIGEIVINKIKPIRGITDTKTLTGIRFD